MVILWQESLDFAKKDPFFSKDHLSFVYLGAPSIRVYQNHLFYSVLSHLPTFSRLQNCHLGWRHLHSIVLSCCWYCLLHLDNSSAGRKLATPFRRTHAGQIRQISNTTAGNWHVDRFVHLDTTSDGSKSSSNANTT